MFSSSSEDPKAEEPKQITAKDLLERSRCVTDLPMLLLYLGYCVGMLVILIVAFSKGDINRLVYGTDYTGVTCTGKAQFWPNPVYYKTLGSICVSACPGSTNYSGSHVTPPANATDPNPANISTTAQTYPSTGMYCHCNSQLVAGMTQVSYSGYSGAVYDYSSVFSTTQYNWNTSVASKCQAAIANGQSYAYWTDDEAAQSQSASKSLVLNSLWNYPNFPMPSQATAYQTGGDPRSYSPTWIWYTDMTTVGYSQVINGTSKWLVPFCNFNYATANILNRCVPSATAITDMTKTICGTDGSSCGLGAFNTYFGSDQSIYKSAMQDLAACWYVILVMFFVAIIFGFCYLILMKYCACCIITTGLLFVNISLIVFSIAFWYYYTILKTRVDTIPALATHTTDEQNMYIALIVAIVFSTVEFVIFCACCCLFDQIDAACRIISMAAAGLEDMPVLLLYPLVNAVLMGGYVALWVAVSAFIGSCATGAPNAIYGYWEWTFTTTFYYVWIYWLFGLLWIAEFSSSVGFTVVCFMYCLWFFTEDVLQTEDGTIVTEEEKKAMDASSLAKLTPSRAQHRWQLFAAIRITLCTFMGTIAFGSCIIAILQLIRIIVAYIQYKKNEMEASGTKIPVYWNVLFSCCQCCLYCLECCMKYLNKNAYIQTVLNDYWFCSALCRVIKIMVDFIDYIMITKPIATGLLAFGRISIAFGTAAVGAYWIYSKIAVSSFVLPVLVIIVIAYVVASMFIEMFEMGIDTMLMCFCEAKSRGSSQHVHPKQLDGFLEDYNVYNDEVQKTLAKKQPNNPPPGSAIEGDATKAKI